MVVIWVVGFAGKSKRKVIPQPQNKEPLVPNNLLEMIKVLGVQPPPLQPVDKVEIIEEPEENHLYGFTAYEEGGSILKGNVLRSESDLKKINKSDTIKDERFSLRKAIIYSEILNRKYI